MLIPMIINVLNILCIILVLTWSSTPLASPFFNSMELLEDNHKDKDTSNSRHITVLYHAIKKTSEKYNIPQELLLAIGIKESNLWPWALNYNKQSYRFSTKEELIDFLYNNKISWNHSFDIGTMQINSQWAKEFNFNIEYILDINNNMDFAGKLLRDSFNRYGDSLRSISTYNTPKINDQAVSYAQGVVSIMKKFMKEKESRNVYQNK